MSIPSPVSILSSLIQNSNASIPIVPVVPYNSTKVQILVDGQPLVGLVKETFCNIKYDAEFITRHQDTSGKNGDYAITNDLSATIEFTVLQRSTANTLLMNKFLLDMTAGTGAFHLIIYDNNNGMKYEAAVAHVGKPADQEFANEMTNRQWTALTTRLVPTQISASDLTQITQAVASAVSHM